MKVSLLPSLLLGALLAGCGGGGDGAVVGSAVARETPAPMVTEVAPSKAPPAPAPGYATDGTLAPPVRDSLQQDTVAYPPRQNARGFSLEDWTAWNATCEAQPQCQIPWSDIEAYNRDVCEAHYPDDAGCPIVWRTPDSQIRTPAILPAS